MLCYHHTIERQMEVEHYAVIGGLMMTCFVIGGAMVSNTYSPPELVAFGNYMIAGGWVMLLILAGFGGYAVLQKVREWNIDRRYDTIDRKSEHLELKKRERELKRREREYKEEQERKEREYRERQRKEQELKKQKEESSEEKNRQTYAPPKTTAEEKSEPAKSTERDLSPEETFKEKSILETGGDVSENLKKKEQFPEEQSTEKQSDNDDYVRHVKMDPVLRGLWYLYISKDGFFLGQTEAARAIFEMGENDEVSGSRRDDVKASMKELEHHGLITAIVVKSDQRGKKIIEYKITQKGKILMGRAIDEKVKRWIDFVEKYKFEMKG